MRFADRFKRSFGLFVIIGFGDKACEAQNGRAICRMTYACKGEGAVKAAFEACELERLGAHKIKKARCGNHRAHCVGGGGAYAHFEHFKH